MLKIPYTSGTDGHRWVWDWGWDRKSQIRRMDWESMEWTQFSISLPYCVARSLARQEKTDGCGLENTWAAWYNKVMKGSLVLMCLNLFPWPRLQDAAACLHLLARRYGRHTLGNLSSWRKKEFKILMSAVLQQSGPSYCGAFRCPAWILYLSFQSVLSFLFWNKCI
jgi:hypothetical protein